MRKDLLYVNEEYGGGKRMFVLFHFFPIQCISRIYLFIFFAFFGKNDSQMNNLVKQKKNIK
jgi:hypothetical protein